MALSGDLEIQDNIEPGSNIYNEPFKEHAMLVNENHFYQFGGLKIHQVIAFSFHEVIG